MVETPKALNAVVFPNGPPVVGGWEGSRWEIRHSPPWLIDVGATTLSVQLNPQPEINIMRLAAEREMAHIGETQGAADHDHDMIHELSKRLDALWRYDQYIANADKHPELQNFWQDLKSQEQQNIQRLKTIMKEHCAKDCF
jgi:hypothetical protein